MTETEPKDLGPDAPGTIDNPVVRAVDRLIGRRPSAPGAYILVDTNIFAERTRLLRTGLGPTLLYIAKLQDSKIVLPDVVRQETGRYVATAVNNLNEQLAKVFKQTREFLGQSPELPPVSEEEVEKALEARFSELKYWLFPV